MNYILLTIVLLLNSIFKIKKILRVPAIHEAEKQWYFTFCLIILLTRYTMYKKIWTPLIWVRVHRWGKWSQSGKAPSGGEAEIGNVKYATGVIFIFSSATRRHFSTLTPLFSTMDHCSKKRCSDFWYVAY